MIKIGMLIADRYEVLEKVGTGGMSDVYKAKDHRLNRMVAVKVLKQEFAENATFVSKFRVEAQAAAGLMHPNIVNVYDVGEEKGTYYIIMELVNGITLKRYVEKKGRLVPREAVTVAIQVAMGLAAAHRGHIIHRDIKPQNIIISTEGKVKVTDFGIAKASTSNTITSNVMGSVHYTSPEQARGGFSDEKSDVYSLGVTLFEMLTGHVPYEGETTVAIALQHIQEPFPSPREQVPEVPYSVEQIVLKCCEKSPDRRYQTMDELVTDLRHSLNDPDGDFVIRAGAENLSETRAMSQKDRDEIRRRTAAGAAGSAAAEVSSSGTTEGAAGRAARNTAAGTVEPGAVSGTGGPLQEDGPGSQSGQSLYPDEEDEEEDEELEEGERSLDKLIQILSIIAVLVVGAVIIIVIMNRRAASSGNAADPAQTPAVTQTEPESGTDTQGEPEPEEPAVQETDQSEQEEEADTVEMPRVIGKKADVARQSLEQLGLTCRIEYDSSRQYEEGIVMAASEDEGAKLEKGAKVTLTVARIKKVKVPDVVKEKQSDAKKALEKLGLVVSVQQVYSEKIKEGLVVSQDPEEDTEVEEGTEVTISVSQGPDLSDKAKVPNILGMTEQEAAAALLKAGLTDGETTVTDTSGRYEPGTVIGQSIEQGEYVDKGTQVDMELSGEPLYSYSAKIEAPRHSEDPDYVEGTPVTLIIETSDGDTILNKTTTEFPYPVSFTGITASKGTLYMTYEDKLTEESQDGMTGETQVTEYTISMEIKRDLTFSKE